MKEQQDHLSASLPEEQKMSTLMDALTLSENRRKSRSPHDPSRTGSAPPGFDSSYLFSYLEGDFYTKSFCPFGTGSKSRDASPKSSPRGYSPPRYLPRVFRFGAPYIEKLNLNY